MAPVASKLTIHPWLDQPVYNRIRYPQWKLYLYNAAQKMCSSMEPTGAYFLVALDADWNAHPKNQVPAIHATHNAAAVPASIRPRPILFHDANHIWSQLHRLHQRPVQVGKRTLRTNRRSRNYSSRGHRRKLGPRHRTHYQYIYSFRNRIAICTTARRPRASTLQYTYYARYQHRQRGPPTPDAEFRRFPRSHHRARQSL